MVAEDHFNNMHNILISGGWGSVSSSRYFYIKNNVRLGFFDHVESITGSYLSIWVYCFNPDDGTTEDTISYNYYYDNDFSYDIIKDLGLCNNYVECKRVLYNCEIKGSIDSL